MVASSVNDICAGAARGGGSAAVRIGLFADVNGMDPSAIGLSVLVGVITFLYSAVGQPGSTG